MVVLLAGRTLAQPLPPVPDSLRAAVTTHQPPAAEALLRVARAYLGPFDSAGVVGYARAAEQTAYRTQQPALAGQALDVRGDYYRESGRPALALPLLLRAGRLLAAAPAALQAQQRYHLGMAYGDLGQPGRALALYREALQLGTADRKLRANVYNSRGLVYYKQNRLDSAVANYFRALRLTPGLASTGIEASTLGNLGLVYLRQQRWAEAARYFRAGKALEAAQGDTMALASSWQYLGRALMGRDSLAAALRCLRLSERLARRSHLANYLPQAWMLMGQAYQRLQQPDSARPYLLRAVATQRQRGAAGAAAVALVSLADFYRQQGQWALAEQTARQVPAASGTNFNWQAQAWGIRREVALHQGNYPAAYAALAHERALQDSLRALDNRQLTEALRNEYETDQALAQVQTLTREREVLRLRRQQQTLATALGAVVLLAGAGLGLGAYRRRQLRRELALRTRLSADLHDEVGGLLTQISMQANLLGAGLYAPEEQQPQLQEMAAASRAAAAQLQDVVWGYDAHNDSARSLLDRMRDYAYELLGSGELTIAFDADPHLPARALPMEARRAVYLIFKEALHNVAKHARQARHVTVALTLADDTLQLAVADDGPAPAQLPRASGHGLRNMRARAEAVGGTCAAGYGAVPGQPGWGVRVRVPV
ncbi:tetratricopeptide repeat-containing sensor histidine kinase [Hymenobacter jeollabukensis]